MNDLREAAQQALEALEMYSGALTHFNEVIDHTSAIAALRAALAQQAEPVEPVAWECREHGDSEWFDCGKESYGINPRRYTYRALYTAPPPPQRPAESVPEPYTDDVTRLMRDAGMTFHLGLPHKAVVEQMTRVVDLVYAEASIKAAQQFATPPQTAELVQEPVATLGYARKIERLIAQRDDLLQALKKIRGFTVNGAVVYAAMIDINVVASRAIKAVEGESHAKSL